MDTNKDELLQNSPFDFNSPFPLLWGGGKAGWIHLIMSELPADSKHRQCGAERREHLYAANTYLQEKNQVPNAY